MSLALKQNLMFNLLTFSFEQAGLLMHSKKFFQYVWEEKPVVLTLPYFSLGDFQLISIYIFPIHVKIICSIFLSWHWNWIINFCVHVRTFVPSSLGKKLESLFKTFHYTFTFNLQLVSHSYKSSHIVTIFSLL